MSENQQLDWTNARWFKSGHSGDGGCVEVAFLGDAIGVRDSKLKDGSPVLAFDRREWDAFLAGVRDGQFGR